MTAYTEVLFEEMAGEGGHLGIITLNRPAVLNSLNHDMILAMHNQLQAWATAVHIKAVIIRAAEGRAFCAGGDIRLAYERAKANDPTAAYFFRDEYQLNRFIFHYPKPYIALLNGITMGGGVGVSIHGSHRIATDNLLFAMPETGIGFFPDVGGTYFLPRLPGKIGFYLGLTGARLKSDDCVGLGIATHKVSSDSLSSIIDALAQTSFSSNPRLSVTEIIERFQLTIQPSTLLAERNAIDTYFSGNTMEELMANLERAKDGIGEEALRTLHKKSPTSLKITLRALQEGQHLSFDDCMSQEFRLTCRFLQGHDFPEGIRAVVIDKDQKPHWIPPTLEGVSQQEIQKYFAPLAHELA